MIRAVRDMMASGKAIIVDPIGQAEKEAKIATRGLGATHKGSRRGTPRRALFCQSAVSLTKSSDFA
jgi:hypothetical protein